MSLTPAEGTCLADPGGGLGRASTSGCFAGDRSLPIDGDKAGQVGAAGDAWEGRGPATRLGFSPVQLRVYTELSFKAAARLPCPAVPWRRRDQGCGCMWGLSILLEPVPPRQLPEEGLGWEGFPGPPSPLSWAPNWSCSLGQRELGSPAPAPLPGCGLG